MVDTPNLQITHVEVSQKTKEATVNDALDDFDGAVAQYLIQAMGDADKNLQTLVDADGDPIGLRHAVFEFTGALTAGRTITLSDEEKLYRVRNNTTGGFSLTFRCVTLGETIVVAPGERATLASDENFDVNLIVSSFPMVGEQKVFETVVGQAALASAGTVILLDANAGEQWKIREIFLSGAGTNFSGGGGDRLLDIKEASKVYSTIPAATLQTLAVARWGDTGTPFPATASDLTIATAAGADLVAQYSGGTTDYTAGSLTLIVTAERTA